MNRESIQAGDYAPGQRDSRLCGRLAIRNTWQTFSRLWRMKPETLCIAFSRALDQRKTLLFQERLNRIIN